METEDLIRRLSRLIRGIDRVRHGYLSQAGGWKLEDHTIKNNKARSPNIGKSSKTLTFDSRGRVSRRCRGRSFHFHIELLRQPGVFFRIFAYLVAGPATRWKAIVPSLVVAGESFRLAIVAEDVWGNPTGDAAGTFELRCSLPVHGLPAVITIAKGDGPRVIEGLVANDVGNLDVILIADGEIAAQANPLRVAAAAALRRYWGDLHGQSGETIGMGTAQVQV
jgi:hypothetical protein